MWLVVLFSNGSAVNQFLHCRSHKRIWMCSKMLGERNVRLLTEAVDDITTIDDFLAVSGMSFSFQYRTIVASACFAF